MVSGEIHAFEFGPFHLDVAERLLLRDKRIVPLTAKTFNILTLLVRKRGRLVDKDELMREVWPDDIVEDNNLTVSMSMLRKALGDSRGGSEYVETVPKCGYRFVANVKEVLTDIQPRGANGETGKPAVRSGGKNIDSIAVLPLTNMTDDPSLEGLSDSITESIINNLSRLPSLKVMARSTVLSYKRGAVDLLKAGREMGVRAVLIGRVDNRSELKVSMELVDVSDGSLIWSERYDHFAPAFPTAQGEIADRISEGVQLKLVDEEKKGSFRAYRANAEAFRLYLKGRYFWDRYTYEGLLKAVRHFQQAIEVEPAYALAYAGLADTYQRISALDLHPREALAKAKAAALKSVEIDDELAEAHASLGLLKVYDDRDWPGAEGEFERALELNPDASLTRSHYGDYLMFAGRFEGAIAEDQTALNLDPLSLQASVTLGTSLCLMRQYNRGIEQLEKALEMDPNYCPAHLALGRAYLHKGDLSKAIARFHTACKFEKNCSLPLGLLGYAYGVAGKQRQAEAILCRLRRPGAGRYVSPYSVAIVYAGLGKSGDAVEWLKKAYDERSGLLVWLGVGPELDSIRSDSKFKELMRQIGFIP